MPLWDRWKRDRHFFDEETKKIYDRIQKELQGIRDQHLHRAQRRKINSSSALTATVLWADITFMTRTPTS